MRSATEPGEQNARSHAANGPEIPQEQIRAALDKILASPGFVNAERLTRFLRYVVDSTLEGQPDKLKETLLGIEVFGRKPTYDPRIDAVVRTEAVKLRARLREYYETEGRDDAVVIDLPKGGYVAVFRVREESPEVVPAPESIAPAPVPPETRDWPKLALAAIAILALAAAVYYGIRKVSRVEARGAELSSIAVLPFEDLSPQHDQEYFCDGMTEEIIDALTRVGGFRVVARTSSFAFKGKQQDIREIGKKLNVGAVLEGSVRKFGNKLRVTAQLNNVADGYHLWSETYERELKDVFSLQDEISQAIVNTLQIKLTDLKGPARPKPGPENIETYDLYLKGRYHWSRWRSEGAEKALHYFEQAIAKDPGYAPAYAGLADSYCWLAFFGTLPPNVGMPKAKQAALKAIQLDDSLAAAHASLGYVNALYDFDWPAAQRQFQRAIELNPGVDDGHFGYGIAYLAPLGRYAEAIRELKLARDLDPLSLATNSYLGLAYQFDGQPQQAIDYYKRALDLDPNFTEAHALFASTLLSRRDFTAFNTEMNNGGATGCRMELLRASAYAIQGKHNEALALVHRWENPPDGSYVRPTSIAGVYATLGDADSAFRWLDRAYAQRDGMLAYLKKEGSFQKYRSDPRYQAILRKVGLPER